MKLVKKGLWEYWSDGLNYWTAAKYTEKQAEKAATTLSNCLNCYDCENCKHCVSCKNCTNSAFCSVCENSNHIGWCCSVVGLYGVNKVTGLCIQQYDDQRKCKSKFTKNQWQSFFIKLHTIASIADKDNFAEIAKLIIGKDIEYIIAVIVNSNIYLPNRAVLLPWATSVTQDVINYHSTVCFELIEMIANTFAAIGNKRGQKQPITFDVYSSTQRNVTLQCG